MLGDPDEVTEFTPKPDALKPMFTILGALAFTAIGFLMVSTAQDTFTGLMGLACIAFFGGGGIVFAWKTLRNPERITFTPEGLWMEGLGGRKLVEWKNVEAIGITSYQLNKFNMLRLRDPERFQPDDGSVVAKLGDLSRNWWGGEIAIGWAQRDRDAEEFGRLLELWRARYG